MTIKMRENLKINRGISMPEEEIEATLWLPRAGF